MRGHYPAFTGRSTRSVGYEIPLFVVENGFGALNEAVVEGGVERIHDPYRTDCLKAHVCVMDAAQADWRGTAT